ncbi:nucleoprotein TPR-like isoform X2 [Tubulanus polymorphus]|uniref:nucleoprotein TPR-like isoform X2 n=1 Tax=Tubulanus polymorphus TaxID=672921 RepID=UPI003DA43516
MTTMDDKYPQKSETVCAPDSETSNQQEHERLRAELEKTRVDYEQKFFDLEKLLITSNGQLEIENNRNAELKEQLKQLDEKHSQSTQKLSELQTEHEKLQLKLSQLEIGKNHLEDEKSEMNLALERKNREIQTLTCDWKEMSEKIAEANKTKYEVLAKLEEVESREITSKHNENRKAQELSRVESLNKWLQDELDKKSDQLQEIRRDMSSRILELSSMNTEKEEEIAALRDASESLRKTNAAQTEKIEYYVEKLKQIRDSQIKIEEEFNNELSAKEKLVKLYKESAQEKAKHKTELLSAVEELQNLLQAAATATENIEKQRVEEVTELTSEISVKDEKIEKMNKELEHANHLLGAARRRGGIPLTEESAETLSPTAAATSKLLKSGMTLTQIYSEYVQTTELLQTEKEEKARLNLQLDHILQEIEDKAPIIKKQREDYDNAIQTIHQMTKQLDMAMLEGEKCRIEADENARKCSHLQRETQRAKQQTLDLGQQVKILMKELEEARGGHVSMNDSFNNVSSLEVTSSSHVISEHLVTFRSIAELQEQNQKLIQVARELSENREEEEKKAVSDKTRNLQEKLEEAVKELEMMKDTKSRHVEMLENVVRQRDMYRVLLAQTTNIQIPSEPVAVSTPAPSRLRSQASPILSPTSTPSAPATSRDTTLDETRKALKEFQEEFNTYRKDRADNEKMLNESINKQNDELSALRVRNAQLSSKLDFANERNAILKTNIENYKKEISVGRDRIQKYNTSVAKHEQSINQLRQELMSSKEQATSVTVQLQNVRTENELLKSIEQRLSEEKQTMMREHQTQNILLTNLQTIQNNLERQEFETKTHKNKQIETLEKEVMILRRKVATTEGKEDGLVKQLTGQLEVAQKNYNEEREKYIKIRDELSDSYAQLHIVKQECTDLRAKLEAAENRLKNMAKTSTTSVWKSHLTTSATTSADGDTTSRTDDLSDVVKDLKAQLGQSSLEVKSLKEQLEQSKRHASQYKGIADSIEQKLKEQNETSKSFKDALESQMNHLKTEHEKRVREVESLDKERQDLMNENIRVTEECHKMNADLRKQLANLQSELEGAMKAREDALEKERAARADCQAQVAVAHEAQSKYERELMLHAADVEALVAVKKELEGFEARLEMHQDSEDKLATELDVKEKSWNEQRQILTEDRASLETRVKELTTQNDLLHQQMNKLSEQTIAIQQEKQGTSSANLNISLSEDKDKSNEQLLEVIKFLRREKEISETKFDVVKSESNRLKQQIQMTEVQVTELKKQIGEEREKSQISVQTALEHADLMLKVEKMNLLTDSNYMLREENSQLKQQLRTAEVKENKSEDDMAKLREKINSTEQTQVALQAEKSALQGEVTRWKNRVNQLIEQSNKKDPEELKRLQQEKDEMRKTIISLREENFKLRTEITQMSNIHTHTQNELSSAKLQIEKLVKDINNSAANNKDQHKKFTADIEEKAKTIAQLRRVGRKYRQQAEDAQKASDAMKEKMASDDAAKGTNDSKVQTLEQEVTTLTENAKQFDAVKMENERKLKMANDEIQQLKSQIQMLTSQKTQTEQQIQTVTSQLEEKQKEMKQEVDLLAKLQADKVEDERKLAQQRNLLQQMKVRFNSQREEIEKLKSSAGDTDTEQTSTRIDQLEKEVQEMKEKLKQKTDEAFTLQSQVEHLQKERDSRSKQSQKLTTATVEIVPSQQKPAPRANIQPIPTPSPSSVQSGAMPSSKVTASIRPMAITTPGPSTVVVTTPTATVMPLQDQDDNNRTALELRPVPPIQTVSPLPEGTSAAVATTTATPLATEPSTHEPAVPFTSTDAGPSAALKRTREDSDGALTEDDNNHMLKRSRTQSEDKEQAQAEESQPEDAVELDNLPDSQHEDKADEDDRVSAEEEGDYTVEDEDESDDVVEEEGGVDVEIDADDDMDEEFEEVECEEYEGSLGDDIEGEFAGGEGEGPEDEDVDDDEMEEDNEDESDDSDVVVISDDESVSTVPTISSTQQLATSQSVDSSMQQTPTLQTLPMVGGVPRTQTTTRAQLTPFTFPNQGTGFEDGDDCTVPSTPTLSLPRRNDGFAEAVSSPQVPHGRFIFTEGSSGQSSELSQLASQGALGMDDTRMDLTQFDEGNRNASTTTSPVPPPVVVTAPAEPQQTTASETRETDGAAAEVDITPQVESTSDIFNDETYTPNEERSSTAVTFTTTEQTVTDDTTVAPDVESTGDIVIDDNSSAQQSIITSVPVAVATDDHSSDLHSDSQTAANQRRIQPIVWDVAPATTTMTSTTPMTTAPIQRIQSIQTLDSGNPRQSSQMNQPVLQQQRMHNNQSIMVHRGGAHRGRGGTARRSRQFSGPRRGGNRGNRGNMGRY